jgi:hypothetical protein
VVSNLVLIVAERFDVRSNTFTGCTMNPISIAMIIYHRLFEPAAFPLKKSSLLLSLLLLPDLPFLFQEQRLVAGSTSILV